MISVAGARTQNAVGLVYVAAWALDEGELGGPDLADQIAKLAAEGLSNREIGQRLYVSHRTISTHLYRIFPKLGVTARGELGAALPAPIS